MRAFLTGGTGFIGGHLVRRLLARGATVRCLVRESSSLARLRDLPVELVRGDLTDAGAVTGLERELVQLQRSLAEKGLTDARIALRALPSALASEGRMESRMESREQERGSRGSEREHEHESGERPSSRGSQQHRHHRQGGSR